MMNGVWCNIKLVHAFAYIMYLTFIASIFGLFGYSPQGKAPGPEDTHLIKGLGIPRLKLCLKMENVNL